MRLVDPILAICIVLLITAVITAIISIPCNFTMEDSLGFSVIFLIHLGLGNIGSPSLINCGGIRHKDFTSYPIQHANISSR
jgi:hypothetical protein